MNSTVIKIALLLAFSAGWFFTSPAAAQQPTPSDNQVNAVAHELYCPVCENIPLDVCPTTACAQWRELIREKLAAGWSKQRIEDYFAAQYGDRVLAVPPLQRSFNQLLPVMIGAGILVGAGLVVWTLRGTFRNRTAQTPEHAVPSSPPATEDEYLRRVEEDLHRRT